VTNRNYYTFPFILYNAYFFINIRIFIFTSVFHIFTLKTYKKKEKNKKIMSRKRSASSIFDDEDEEQSPSRTTSQYRRVRSISNVIDDEQSSSSRSTTTPSRRNPSRIRSIGIVIEDDDEETMNQGSQSTIAGPYMNSIFNRKHQTFLINMMNNIEENLQHFLSKLLSLLMMIFKNNKKNMIILRYLFLRPSKRLMMKLKMILNSIFYHDNV